MILLQYWERQEKVDGQIVIDKLDMIKHKSKYDTNILYDEKNGKYGYQLYANRGDVVIIDEQLVSKLEGLYADAKGIDCTGVTQKFVMCFIAYLERIYGFTTCKFGLDPNKAGEIESFINMRITSQDEWPPAIKFRMELSRISNPLMEATKDIRARELVYCNNKLTELHFANAQAEIKSNGNIVLVNPKRARKDGVIAHLAARSAYNAFTINSKTGEINKQRLVRYWSDKS